MNDNEMNGRVSGLSIVSLVLSILGFTSLIGFVLSIIDLRRRDGRNRVCSIIAVVISSLYLAVGIPVIILAGIVTGKVFGTLEDSGNSTIVTENTVQMTTVPNLIGLSVVEASDQLTKAGLTAKAMYVENSTVEKDYVVSQDLEPGTEVVRDTVINILVSSGP